MKKHKSTHEKSAHLKPKPFLPNCRCYFARAVAVFSKLKQHFANLYSLVYI